MEQKKSLAFEHNQKSSAFLECQEPEVLEHDQKSFTFLTCSQCGVCCRLFLINLNPEEYKSCRYKTQFEEFGLTSDFMEAEMCGANIITQKKDGSCFYLADGKCSIHSARPQSCRNFFCSSKDPEFKTMIEKIKESKMSS